MEYLNFFNKYNPYMRKIPPSFYYKKFIESNLAILLTSGKLVGTMFTLNEISNAEKVANTLENSSKVVFKNIEDSNLMLTKFIQSHNIHV